MDIQRVIREGKVRRTGSLTVRMCSSPSSHMRVGIVVPLHGQTAVKRNRLKRQLRELTRMELLDDQLSVDVLISGGSKAYERSFSELREEVRKIQQSISDEAR